MSDVDRVMLDVESLGTDPGCMVVQIGAVRFDEDGLCHDDGDRCEFETSVSMKSCDQHGLTVDSATLGWWLGQKNTAEILTGGIPLESALADFAAWYGDADQIWAKAPLFDVAVLGAAYDAIGLERPWDYWQTRCVRTAESLPVEVDVDHNGTEHDALDDAVYQARVVSETLATIGGAL